MEGPPAGSGLKIKPNQKSVKGRLSRGAGGGGGREGGVWGGRGGREGGVCLCVCGGAGRAGGTDGLQQTECTAGENITLLRLLHSQI